MVGNILRADDGNVRGSRRFFALLGLVLVVHSALEHG